MAQLDLPSKIQLYYTSSNYIAHPNIVSSHRPTSAMLKNVPTWAARTLIGIVK